MIRRVLRSGDPLLRKISKPVVKFDKKLKTLVSDLTDTLINHKDPEGVGLAAPQIGKNVQVFVMLDKKEVTTIINPKIINTSKKHENTKPTRLLEGCLSVPHYYAPLTKPDTITISYMTESGVTKTESFKGFKAQLIQHEIDHLNGILFIDDIIAKNMPLYKQNIAGDWEEVEL